MKTSDMIEQRAGIVARMNAAHETDDNAAFEAADSELRALDAKLDRQRKIDAADRTEIGTPINGDNKLTSEIRSRFHIGRAIAGAAGLAVDWGFEREVQTELAKRAGRNAEGVFIPTECFETRVLTTAAGSELVPTEHRPDQYISALVASSVVRGMGARVLSGLTGNLSIPRETDSPAIGWVAENSALTADDADFDAITLSPKHAGALSEWSRNMLMQASPDVESLLRQMLARNLALAIDRAAIRGGGTNEPKGVLETTGIQKVTAPASLFDAVADAVALADVANVGASRGLLTTPEIRKIAAKALDANGLPIGIDKVLGGVSATFSNQVPKTLGGTPGAEHGMIYGDWSELLIGIWSEIDILVNPFESTAYSKGNVMIRAMATVDCAVRHPKAFVSVEDVTTATPAMPEVVTP
ncbi:HK97 family phage major capsid protein [Sphingobium wenxiniae]|uniref:HK97 family phage major capsid protein n=1 Tax=Sphingobium wenxiniae (strain DSM 21828 / CGMCC 1.7748 / JZ-1) TaxID=595605 RepID=A0A562KIU3_SPHWJ|nr:phage major capsid protein [Sphingobium wenxiniae]MBB6192863.1 HK97 family phage major capsid protein [Sphingobium wenxiniae]TWH95328.1 HK97 family phage major capsid protein [Sphingobium wenxiniae]